MNETCDRCGPETRADYRLDSPHSALLTLCVPCAQRYWQVLHDRGWQITPLTRVSSAPQAA